MLDHYRVLVVEDQFLLATDVARALRRSGAEVMGPFPGQTEALAAMRDALPDFAILDVNLGGGASFDLADRLVEHAIPFLFFTGYDREAIPQRFADVVRLEKPVDDSRLIKAAAVACGKTVRAKAAT